MSSFLGPHSVPKCFDGLPGWGLTRLRYNITQSIYIGLNIFETPHDANKISATVEQPFGNRWGPLEIFLETIWPFPPRRTVGLSVTRYPWRSCVSLTHRRKPAGPWSDFDHEPFLFLAGKLGSEGKVEDSLAELDTIKSVSYTRQVWCSESKAK